MRVVYEMRRHSGRTQGIPVAGGGGGGDAPAPGAGDTIMFDTRSGGIDDIQVETTLAGALAQFSENIGGITWATDFDGLGTRAFRHQYTAATAGCTQQEQSHWLRRFLSGSTAQEIFIQFKCYFGRNPNDSGSSFGAEDDFKFTNDPCNTANGTNYGMKLATFGREDHTGRTDIIFGGPGPTQFSLRCDTCFQFSGSGDDGNEVASPAWRPQDHLGQKLTITFYGKCESSPGAADGIWRAWIDGQMIIEAFGKKSGTSFWGAGDAGPEFISVINTSVQDQMIYTWDHVIWVPA